MHAKNFLIDESCDRQAVKHVTEDAPESNGVTSLAFVVEAVNTVDLGTFMVSSEEEEVLGVLNFVAKKQTHRLDRLLSSVNVIAQEKIVCLRWEPSVLKYSQQIVVLTMYVT